MVWRIISGEIIPIGTAASTSFQDQISDCTVVINGLKEYHYCTSAHLL